MDEAQKSIIEESKLKTVEYMKKVEVPMIILMCVAMGILFVVYVMQGNITFGIVSGIFFILQIWTLFKAFINNKIRKTEKQPVEQILGTPPYIS